LFIDLSAQAGSKETEADVCIIGGGAAGITLARALASSTLKVVLLESGRFRLDPKTQDLYKGESVGLPYGGLDETRFRYFGGSTNPEGWGGWCRPLDPIDFETRSWAPHSGWPFSQSALDHYYRQAQVICEVGPYDYDLESWRRHIGPELHVFPLHSDRVETQLAHLGPPTRFGVRYREDLRGPRNVKVYLGANVLEILATPDGSEATGVLAVSFEGNRLHVRSRIVVLAAGGIENARLLLLSGGANSKGLGNENDVVGRFFADHPRLEMGTLELSGDRGLPELYDPFYKFRRRKRSLHDVYDLRLVSGSLNLTDGFQRQEGLLNYRTWILPKWPGDDSDEIQALKRLYIAMKERTLPRDTMAADLRSVLSHPRLVSSWAYGRLARPKRLVQGIKLVNILEPEQRPDSRVMLSDQVDPLGQPRVRLDWQVGPLVRRTLAKAHEAIDEDLRSSGVGRLVDPFKEDDEERFRKHLNWVWHHMSTTRMHDDPDQGVVDANTRMHTMSNVYVQGSSVFPTPGADMPTLTIVALALRLADHLRDTLSPGGAQEPRAQDEPSEPSGDIVVDSGGPDVIGSDEPEMVRTV
jgi:choline dehydrogenase-like flavoprotein